mgnify:CR=1 FL=1
MIKKFLSFLLLTYSLHLQSLFAQSSIDGDFFKEEFSYPNQRIIPCATPDPTVEQIIQSKAEVDEWLMQNENRNRNQVVVYVIWHVIYASDGTGNISDNRIIAQIEAMNQEFQNNNSNIFFSLDSINRVENTEWFTGWAYFGDALDDEGMQELHYDPAHYLNIYSAQLYDSGAGSLVTLGYTAFPTNLSETSYMQGFTLDHRAVSGGLYGSQSAVHEAGHYFGLYHTFQTNCLAPDDAVDDTPRNDENYLQTCNIQDTCPNDPGNDPVENHMNYSGDNCQDTFTPGQNDRMHAIIDLYHPSLLDNQVFYPVLSVDAFSFLNDTDGDNRFNPGDTTRVKIVLLNEWGGDAVNVSLTLETDDPRVTILDNYISFNDSPLGDITILPGEISSTVFDWFLITSDADAVPGNIQCTVTMTAGTEEYPYEEQETINLDLTLSQFGFPLDGIVVKSSPIVADLDSDGVKEIYFGSDNEALHGYNSFGEEIDGFPFQSTDRVRSSPAVGDVDNDGQMEIVFGNSSGKLYIVNHDGSQQLAYSILGFIEGSPALVDADGDQDLEIIFNTTTTSGGKLYAIHHNGITMSGFPKELGSMWVGPAVHDIDNDGVYDIICATYDKEVYAVNIDGGAIKSGFPVITQGRLDISPTVVDVDSDGDYEIAVGSNDGELYILHHDGTIFAQYDTGDDIRGGISVCDLNNDGQLDLLFGGYDDKIHVWDPVANELLPGWPVDLGFNILSEPLIADLDGDGQVEVLAARKTGKIFGLESDGSMMTNFPIAVDGSIESTPAIEDIDNDGDLEIIVGSTSGLEVIDIKSSAELMDSWSMYRGNMHRTGVYDASVMSVENNEIIPKKFYVSQNYPNPFNPSTSFYIDMPEAGNLLVKVFDVNGRMVKELINTYVNGGRIQARWSGKNEFDMMSPTGIYFLQVETSSNYHVQKLALVK